MPDQQGNQSIKELFLNLSEQIRKLAGAITGLTDRVSALEDDLQRRQERGRRSAQTRAARKQDTDPKDDKEAE